MRTKSIVITGAIALLSGVGFGRSVKQCDLLPKPENVVGSPPYVIEKHCPNAKEPETPPEKLQYRADSEGKPFFEEKDSAANEENGARYEKGAEVYVQPDPTYRKTEEAISDEDQVVPEALPDK